MVPAKSGILSIQNHWNNSACVANPLHFPAATLFAFFSLPFFSLLVQESPLSPSERHRIPYLQMFQERLRTAAQGAAHGPAQQQQPQAQHQQQQQQQQQPQPFMPGQNPAHPMLTARMPGAMDAFRHRGKGPPVPPGASPTSPQAGSMTPGAGNRYPTMQQQLQQQLAARMSAAGVNTQQARFSANQQVPASQRPHMPMDGAMRPPGVAPIPPQQQAVPGTPLSGAPATAAPNLMWQSNQGPRPPTLTGQPVQRAMGPPLPGTTPNTSQSVPTGLTSQSQPGKATTTTSSNPQHRHSEDGEKSDDQLEDLFPSKL